MTIQDLWEKQYRNNRYMIYLSVEELKQRSCDIVANISTLTAHGQIGVVEAHKGFWWERFTHMLEEIRLRNIADCKDIIGNAFSEDLFPIKPTYPEIPRAQRAIEKIKGLKGNVLFRFGGRKWLEPMFKDGMVRISPASSYNDPSLNKAIHDNELSFQISKRPADIVIHNQLGTKFPLQGKFSYRVDSKTNYYVFCLSNQYTRREYDDFGADSCIIIKNPTLFFKKLNEEMTARHPNMSGSMGPVKYFDPLNCNPLDINIIMAKHFKYWYQNEVRAVWVPKTPLIELDYEFINIGSMERYAEIVNI